MAERRSRQSGPITRVRSGIWPDADVGDDPAAVYAQTIARGLAMAIGGRSLREVAAQTGVDFTTVRSVLRGATWPSVATVARLEVGLGVRLWPDG